MRIATAVRYKSIFCAFGMMASFVIKVATKNSTGKNAFPPKISLIMGWYVFSFTKANPLEISGKEVITAKMVAPNTTPLIA